MLADAPKPGTRVAAFAPTFFMHGAPDYCAFQTRVIVLAANAVPLPEGTSFVEASLCPVAVVMAVRCGAARRDTVDAAADGRGMLAWSGASSVGMVVVQVGIKCQMYVKAPNDCCSDTTPSTSISYMKDIAILAFLLRLVQPTSCSSYLALACP